MDASRVHATFRQPRRYPQPSMGPTYSALQWLQDAHLHHGSLLGYTRRQTSVTTWRKPRTSGQLRIDVTGRPEPPSQDGSCPAGHPGMTNSFHSEPSKNA